MDRNCARCGVSLEAGFLQARGTEGSFNLVSVFSFVKPGTATSWNPIEAFRQGLAGGPEDGALPVSVCRCRQCGLLEMYADKRQ